MNTSLSEILDKDIFLPFGPFCQIFVLQQCKSNDVSYPCGPPRTVLTFRSKTLPLVLEAVSFSMVPCFGTKQSSLGSVTGLILFLCGWTHSLSAFASVHSTEKYSVLLVTCSSPGEEIPVRRKQLGSKPQVSNSSSHRYPLEAGVQGTSLGSTHCPHPKAGVFNLRVTT